MSSADAASLSSGDEDLGSRTQQSPLASQRAQQQSRTYFPLGYKAGFSQWWANIPAAVAEHRVLSFIPHLQAPPTHTKTGSQPASPDRPPMVVDDDQSQNAEPVTTASNTDPYGPRRWASNLVTLSGKNRALNEFSVERIGEDVEQNLVMLHGYGAGLGFFYKNFEALSRVQGWKVYALDMLGMGRSSRPPFKVHSKDSQGKITEAENWFIDALEEWRIQKKIDRFTLLGHSMGGYMAVAYALKYPGHVNKLILASPVGIPEDPYAVKADMPEPNASTMNNEFTQSESDIIHGSNPEIPDSAKVGAGTAAGDHNNFLNARSSSGRDANSGSKTTPSAPRRPLPKWLVYLWDSNISPFSIVRWAGPLGPRFVSGWTSRRFSHLPSNESQALHDYSYSLFRQQGSGEYALAYILAPGAFARSPLIRRIQGVGRQWIDTDSSSESPSSCSPTSSPSPPAQSTTAYPNGSDAQNRVRENGIPVVMMYGENDWMDIAGGYAAEQKINDEKARLLRDADAETRRKDNGSAKVVVIRRAGHHVYLDGWEHFNQVMLEEMKDVSKREAQR
ncbi:alpha/beta-hydrolase [Xylona heveae TC161]|uniref:Alpha/beta-hydrolase n=1 Tax=Xylona heveae (strain CBS 132557 / TC161) TaxID=1328760 RepID=A0A165HGM0_XYLHT|nr:alpha/beta-hydrolase [Xylona heveae TC161]KZF23483.1 alpha/beta-hydrolase [Xylona heveae TC161]